ncbi:hypothetical protein [Acidovorax facilis]|jgi:hypothetical protein|uniref:hypothetical protein n=1 Tax=Acidovorax facilis TaxID=12917 RepID=UPI003D659BD4
MNRRFAIQCMGAAALGLGNAAMAAVPLRHARAGTASVLAWGAAGAGMLDHALAWGQCGWEPLESAWDLLPEPPQARVFLADPSEPGVCGALADSVDAAASSGLMALAVLEGTRPVVDEPTLGQLQRIQQRADLVVSLPKERFGKAVVWEGVLAPFMEDSSVCLAVDDLRDPAWRKASATVGCGWGATPVQAMVAAMADPALTAPGARELGDMLVALTLGSPHTLLRDVFDACKLLRARAPHGRLGMSFRSRPSLGPLALVHLVALRSGS